LETLCLPASLQVVTGASFGGICLKTIKVDPANPFLRAAKGFLTDIDGRRLIRYFGRDWSVTIPDGIEVIGAASFNTCRGIQSVVFGPNSKVSVIEREAFEECEDLEEIKLPASVKSIGESCFSFCQGLQRLSFTDPVQFTELPASFCDHTCVRTVVIPSIVEVLGDCCFAQAGVESITFLPDTRLVRIGASAFSRSRFHDFCVPATVEYIGRNSFDECNRVENLTFLEPSRLRELLDLPPVLRKPIQIPDSVERIRFCETSLEAGGTVEFGNESRLAHRTITRTPISTMNARGEMAPLFKLRRGFLRFCSRSLKLFRADAEFEEAATEGKPKRLGKFD
jgi:hypothetical protein